MRHVSIVISVAALVIAIVALGRERPSSQHACKDTSSEVKRLEQEVRVLRGSLAQVLVAPTHAIAADVPSAARLDARLEPPAPAPHYVRFDAPRGLTIEAGENGAISVSNNDQSLTGKTLAVPAQRDDGTSEIVTITVPPPQR